MLVGSACSLTDPMPRRSEPGAHLATTDAGADVVTTTPAPPADGGAVCHPTKSNVPPIPWAPPGPLHVAACNPQQVDFLARSMLITADDTAGLQAWDRFYVDPVNETCLKCAVTDANANPRGPIYFADYYDGDYWFTSHEGCVAALAGDGGKCGAKLFSLERCSVEVCGHCPDEASWNGCVAISDATSCAPYADALDCMQPFEEQCYGKATDDYVDVVKRVIQLFCTGG